jgi:hypothetical protein
MFFEDQRPNFDAYPVTFSGYVSDQVRAWDELFPAERDYFTRLAALLATAPTEFFDPLRAIEVKMGVNERNWPKGKFTLEQVDFLNRNAHYAEWRAEIARLFSIIDPQLDEQVKRKGRPRLIVVMSPADLPAGPDRMWLRIAQYGQRLKIEAPPSAAALLVNEKKENLLDLAAGKLGPYESWVVETGDGASKSSTHPKTVRLSYLQLEAYRLRLMAEVRRVTESEEIRGPRQLGARLKTMRLRAAESEFSGDPVMNEFVRATLLNGNGTLLVNNTFVEWATAQAIRRVRHPQQGEAVQQPADLHGPGQSEPDPHAVGHAGKLCGSRDHVPIRLARTPEVRGVQEQHRPGLRRRGRGRDPARCPARLPPLEGR